MPTPTKVATPSPPELMYPAIESFIERASAGDVSLLFASLKEGLSALKGPKADQSKKVKAAIDRTEELLAHLLEVREKLIAEQGGPSKARK